MRAGCFPPAGSSSRKEERLDEHNRGGQKLNDQMFRTTERVDLHAFSQEQSLREIVGDGNGRQNYCEDTADDD